jgi:nicotinate-nucleotide adenylyltransferase
MDNPQFDVDDLELHRSGPSYTLDTVRELKARGWDEVTWLIGADMLPTLTTWHEPEALLREARLLVMARPGSPIDIDALPALCRPVARENMVTAPRIEISASEIRRRIGRGESVRWMTPAGVEDYMYRHRLYGAWGKPKADGA